jgi:hypothetical protein
MGLPTFAKLELKKRYGDAFSFKRKHDPSVIVYDLMKDVKYMPTDYKNPENSVNTLDDAIYYCTNKIKHLLHNSSFKVRVIIVCVDRKPPSAKRLITHGDRYDKKNVFSHKDNKAYLPEKLSDLIPNPWIQFAGNYRLLQREFYPRLFNAFMDGIHILPGPGQMIVLHGFPGKTEYVPMYSQRAYIETDDRGFANQIHMWKESSELPISREEEKRDPDLYNRIYYIENIIPGINAKYPQGGIVKEEWVDAKNTISESDGAMFFYDHWFKGETIMYVCNDGDLFAYGLLYAFERVQMNNEFRNIHLGMVPYKSTKSDDYFPEGKKPRWEYVDFNHFFTLVQEDDNLKQAGVQNHELTIAFLLILSGSDFLKKHIKGIGKEVVWKVFFSCTSLFSHLVQMSKGVERDTRTYRNIVLDEDLFRIFIHYCYIEKYGTPARKRMEKEQKKRNRNNKKQNQKVVNDAIVLTYDELKLHCSLGKKAEKDATYQLPDRNTIRKWSRIVLWNLLYYKNTPLGTKNTPNPFVKWEGLPLYPFIINPDTGKAEMSSVVSAFQPPVDECMKQFMYKTKLERPKRSRNLNDEAEQEEITKRQRAIVDAF